MSGNWWRRRLDDGKLKLYNKKTKRMVGGMKVSDWILGRKHGMVWSH